MMKDIRGLLFDFNGTLFFDSRIHMEAFRRVCALYSVPVFSDEYMIKGVFGRTNERIFKENFNPDATAEECERFNSIKKQLYFDICLTSPDLMHLVEGVEELLDYVKSQGIPYALATGSDREEVDFFIRHLGLDRWFDESNIVYTDGTFRGKPDPDCYLIAARKISLSPSECAVFEDGKSGIAAAHAAGCGRVIAICERGIPSPLDADTAADAEYHSLAEWRDILDGLGM